jgi:hypothetical protein
MNEAQLRRRAQWALLRGRVRASALELFVVLGLIGVALFLAKDRADVVLPAALLLGVALLLSLAGPRSSRLVLPALLVSIVPLACSLGAQHVGHVCMDGGCHSLCVPLCSAGGLLAGVLNGRMARAAARPGLAWLGGGVLVVSAGAMGCVCVGAGGVVGMTLGVLAGAGFLLWPARVQAH